MIIPTFCINVCVVDNRQKHQIKVEQSPKTKAVFTVVHYAHTGPVLPPPPNKNLGVSLFHETVTHGTVSTNRIKMGGRWGCVWDYNWTPLLCVLSNRNPKHTKEIVCLIGTPVDMFFLVSQLEKKSKTNPN